MKQFYQDFRFQRDTLALIQTINRIVEDYQAQGFTLTVRQLYYQLVARDIIPNTEKSYKRTTGIVNDARLAGFIDWDAIEDRTRSFNSRPHWDSGAQILKTCASQFHMDMWEGQDRRVYVIVEKEALAGVLEGVCHKYSVPLLAARGYPSASVMREFAKYKLLPNMHDGQQPLILHLGDHDPSGIDMTRDLSERLVMFTEGAEYDFEIERIALNMNQIEEFKPPPNPAKSTDARFENYQREFGDSSWELDALEPRVLINLVESHVCRVIDEKMWEQREQEIDEIKKRIAEVAKEFE